MRLKSRTKNSIRGSAQENPANPASRYCKVPESVRCPGRWHTSPYVDIVQAKGPLTFGLLQEQSVQQAWKTGTMCAGQSGESGTAGSHEQVSYWRQRVPCTCTPGASPVFERRAGFPENLDEFWYFRETDMTENKTIRTGRISDAGSLL